MRPVSLHQMIWQSLMSTTRGGADASGVTYVFAVCVIFEYNSRETLGAVVELDCLATGGSCECCGCMNQARFNPP